MILKASFKKHLLKFRKPARTSRDTLLEKETWILFIRDVESNVMGIGECSTIRGLSIDEVSGYEEKLKEICEAINFSNSLNVEPDLEAFPSIRFGLEVARLDFLNNGTRKIFDTRFYQGDFAIPINGLVWMGDLEFMKSQVRAKIDQGFDCIKIKIGALDFNDEIELLKKIRKEHRTEELQLRVDANGAFSPGEALEKLKRLSDFELHSIEQPVKPGQYEKMARLCEQSPLDIALDEELIGVSGMEQKEELLHLINPQYIILKPSLVGGIKASEEWIELAERQNIGWWATSALESNIGLNAISQWVSTYDITMHQGLGTGQLYQNNIESPLSINKGFLCISPEKKWELSSISTL